MPNKRLQLTIASVTPADEANISEEGGVVFSAKSYYEVNREERHFGFLFMSALVVNMASRRDLVEYINSKSGVALNPDAIDVYAEVSLFRDYWRDLGNPGSYSDDTHSQRHKIFVGMLDEMQLDPAMIESEPVFWTGAPCASKLFYPGKWAKAKINAAEEAHGLTEKQLWRLRWACNAKPDVMIEDPDQIVFIEIKVESDFGRSENGYSQVQTQEDILRIGRSVIPALRRKQTKLTTLTFDGPGLKWSEICQILESSSTPDVFEMVVRHLGAMPS